VVVCSPIPGNELSLAVCSWQHNSLPFLLFVVLTFHLFLVGWGMIVTFPLSVNVDIFGGRPSTAGRRADMLSRYVPAL
jgi:hypothetical protein